MTDDVQRPWYRQVWPWLLAVPPVSAMVFWGVILATLAGPPELVNGDTRRVGLVYTQAGTSVEGGRLQLQRGERRIAVALRSEASMPDRLTVTLDGAAPLTLRPDASGVYRGDTAALGAGEIAIAVTPPDAGWRLAGRLPAGQDTLTLEAAPR